MKNELVIVIDFGGQYNQLVARRVRECNVYCEIYSYKIGIDKIKEMNPKGIILTGGPNSCYEPDSPTYSKELFELGIPVLGLCYGAQLMQHVLGGKVEKAEVSEYGKTEVLIDKKDSKLFENVSEKTICWMSHTDYISQVAPGFEISAHTADCPVATAENADKSLYAIQFHPEVLHTVEGTKMINNFVKNVCECAGDWKIPEPIDITIDLERSLRDTDVAILAVPSPYTRSTCKRMAPFVKNGQKIVNVAKGVEEKTLLTLSEIIEQELPQANVSVLSGPSHAEEVGKGLPTTCVVSSHQRETAEYLQGIFMSPVFRVYTTPDMLGVELGAALKNVIALAAGTADGLGYGDNTKAALITRGIAEISRLGVKMGARMETFYGLSGIGDLIVTCASVHSRNRKAGYLMGKGCHIQIPEFQPDDVFRKHLAHQVPS